MLNRRAAKQPSRRPSLRVERRLQRDGYPVVVGMDEVGRGALAGPVSVGAVAIDLTSRSAPRGVKDSKLLSSAVRTSLVPPIQRWALSYGVGHASPEEIDTWGIMTGLRLAGQRALRACDVTPDLVLLDGNYDWLTAPDRIGLFAEMGERDSAGVFGGPERMTSPPPVQTMVKGDLRCSSVAAASVLAKVERDTEMVRLHEGHPIYEWKINKGYAAPRHVQALRERGPCEHHRRSWNLTGTTQEVAVHER